MSGTLTDRASLLPTSRWTVPVGVAVGVGADLAFDPVHRHVPLCPFRALTGWDCPLCGSLRAVERLAHGQVDAAVHANLLLVVSLPLLAWMWLDAQTRSAAGQPRRAASPRVIAAMVLLSAAFTVVRNVPSMSALRPT